MKIVFSHWRLPGGGTGPICYHIGQYLAKRGENVIFYTKKIDRPIKYGKVIKFKERLREQSAKRIMKDRPDFAYVLEVNAYQVFNKMNGKYIHPAYGDTAVTRKKLLINEKPFLFDEDCSAKKYGYDSKTIKEEKEILVQPQNYLHITSQVFKQNWINQGCDKDKIILAPHGIDIEIFKSDPILHKHFKILFVGNGVTRKGLQYLIKAWQILKKIYKTIELTIISEQIWKVNDPNIQFIRKAPKKNMPFHYNNNDVLILPSLSDGMPLAGLEAMACGLPVVLTKDIGYNEIINDEKNGFLIKKKDVKAIIDCVQLLIKNPTLRKQISKQARKTAEQNTWDIQGEKFRRILYKSDKNNSRFAS